MGCNLRGYGLTFSLCGVVSVLPEDQSMSSELMDQQATMVNTHSHTRDPGIVRAEGPLQEVLRGVGEGIVKGYCSDCQLASPPLAHHCRLCVACHHQTDHHCLFLNTCIAANNHWYFVVFIMTNIFLMIGFLSGAYRACVMPGVQGDWVDQLTAHVLFLLNEDMWTALMVICNGASLIWAFYLLK
ncbi:Palmitoyltransferase erf2 [Portunus trituberculatus]|uniref:Palmitoyltransferase n=1 Tax=Portunus trituberculatus TaxID=210409 RepID=A0A5B7GVZ7_PORTR|nr:Palmitoyltransferase erf2 [Portunus trituberculatus]